MKRKVPNTNQNNTQNNIQKSLKKLPKKNVNVLNLLPTYNKREIIKKLIEVELNTHSNGIAYLLKKDNPTGYKEVKFYKRNNTIMATLAPPKVPDAIKSLSIPKLKKEIIDTTRENYRRLFKMEMTIDQKFFRSKISKADLYKMYVSADGIKSYTLEEIENIPDFDIYELIQLDTIQKLNRELWL